MLQKDALGDGNVEVVVCREPCLLLEAAELVYALVNDIPAERLTQPGEYCIPAEQVRSIQKTACAGLSPEDSRLQFYFRGVPLEGESRRLSCVGCCLLYSAVEVAYPAPEDMVRALSEGWARRRAEHYRINGISPFSLNIDLTDDNTFSTISEEIEKLPVSPTYKMRLVEAFSAYEFHVAQLARLLQPVTAALERLLEPWVKRARPRMLQWEKFFQEHTVEEFLLKRASVKFEGVKTLQLGFRYFSPAPSPIYFDEKTGCVSFHAGICVQPELEEDTSVPEKFDCTALRMLANPDRVEMLRLMMGRTMGVPELSKLLHLNSGSVFRDVNSMCNAKLLLFQPENGKNLYCTNLDALAAITDQLLEYVKSGGQENG